MSPRGERTLLHLRDLGLQQSRARGMVLIHLYHLIMIFQILDRGSKKSQQLREELMRKEGGIPTLSGATSGLSQALAYRDKLLLADANSYVLA